MCIPGTTSAISMHMYNNIIIMFIAGNNEVSTSTEGTNLLTF